MSLSISLQQFDDAIVGEARSLGRKLCPHLTRLGTGYACKAELEKMSSEESAQIICDSASLQLWCTDSYRTCIYFPNNQETQ